MELRQRNKKISSELGMSSMTDIIFILLIFFMMISTLVHPSALNLSLPSNSKTSKKPATTEHLDDIGITESGGFIFNGVSNRIEQIKNYVTRSKNRNPNYSVTISPDSKAPVEKVVQVLDITQSLGINSVLHASAE